MMNGKKPTQSAMMIFAMLLILFTMPASALAEETYRYEGMWPVLLYLIGHGGSDEDDKGYFMINPGENLEGSRLNSWLNELQTTLPGKTAVVYEACYSGNLLSALEIPPDQEGPNKSRIVLTSSSENQEAPFLKNGSLSFSYYFWADIFKGEDIRDAFGRSSDAVIRMQDPQLDGDSNGESNTAQDYDAVRNVFIGKGNQIRWIGDDVLKRRAILVAGGSQSDELWPAVDGNPPPGYFPLNSPSGILTINDLRIGTVINTTEKGFVDALWHEGGDSLTAGGHQVLWGYFHANPGDVSWGSVNNPDLFVKVWFDAGGRVDVNYFHVSVPDIEVYSAFPDEGIYHQKGTTMMENRYIRHEYWR